MIQATTVLSVMVACALGAPQALYRPPVYPTLPPTTTTTVPTTTTTVPTTTTTRTTTTLRYYQRPASTTTASTTTTRRPPCPGKQIRNALGKCVDPDVTRDLFVFKEPDADSGEQTTDRPIPKPKVKVNLVVIQKADDVNKAPIIIPPPQERTLVLVLSKKGDDITKVIEVPAPPGQQPEVFFIDYEEGENTLLPGGIFLQDALKQVGDGSGGSGMNAIYGPPGPGY